jgi:hypothetical protein
VKDEIYKKTRIQIAINLYKEALKRRERAEKQTQE